tara:strand:- start:4907 stop:5173 length:267 start_codon:yes stop_codon:yes gene_type:complete
MRTYIVLIPVDDSLVEPRKGCEAIENTHFKIIEGVMNPELRILDKVQHELGINSAHNIEVMLITDFMDRVNNEEFDVDGYFISYVYSN